MKTNIYGLYDEKGNIKYIGKTVVTIERRRWEHLWDSENGGITHKKCWIRSMLSKGKLPKIKLIVEVPTDGEEAERFYIAYFKMLGADLTNGTIGGEGGNWGHTPEIEKKRIESRRKNGTLKGINNAKKAWETKHKNNYSRSSESSKKTIETKRKNGIPFSTKESCKKGIETKRLLGKLTLSPESYAKGWETRRLKKLSIS